MQKLCGIRVDVDCVGDIDALPAALDLVESMDEKLKGIEESPERLSRNKHRVG